MAARRRRAASSSAGGGNLELQPAIDLGLEAAADELLLGVVDAKVGQQGGIEERFRLGHDRGAPRHVLLGLRQVRIVGDRAPHRLFRREERRLASQRCAGAQGDQPEQGEQGTAVAFIWKRFVLLTAGFQRRSSPAG